MIAGSSPARPTGVGLSLSGEIRSECAHGIYRMNATSHKPRGYKTYSGGVLVLHFAKMVLTVARLREVQEAPGSNPGLGT